MSSSVETNVSILKQIWTRIAQYAKALEGMDDPVDDYMFTLGKRVDKLERDMTHLERRLPSRAGGGAVSDRLDS